MDVLQVHRMVETTLERLKQFSRSSLLVVKAAKQFSNNYFEHENIEIIVQDNFPEVKIHKIKIIDVDSSEEYIPPSAYQKFAVDTYNITFDTLITNQ